MCSSMLYLGKEIPVLGVQPPGKKKAWSSFLQTAEQTSARILCNLWLVAWSLQVLLHLTALTGCAGGTEHWKGLLDRQKVNLTGLESTDRRRWQIHLSVRGRGNDLLLLKHVLLFQNRNSNKMVASRCLIPEKGRMEKCRINWDGVACC